MPLTAENIDFLRGVVAKQSGHVISEKQGYLFESRLRNLAESEGHDSVDGFVSSLRSSRRTNANMLIAEAMTINETFFFRDSHPFDAMRSEIVPNLMAARQSQRRLNIWCAASSTGQEPYSIAITLKDHFPELSNWQVKIIATDLSAEVLKKAQEGKYTQFEVNRGLPVKMLVKYFARAGANWQIKPEIRNMIEFRQMNLANPWPMMPKFDVVFLRNVLIYFSAETKTDILTRLSRNMASDAYLLLGGGETLINLNTPFVRETLGGTVGYRPKT